jgi:DNA-binding NarL/FixJ family response regulator
VIRVLLAEDQALVRDGLRMMLAAEPDIEVVGEAADGKQALELVRRLVPDVALMDVRMPELNGIEATRRLAAAGSPVRVLVVTCFDLDLYVGEARRAGASGFLLKDARREQLAAAIRAVSAGEMLIDPAVTRRLVEDFCRRPPPTTGIPAAAEELTERELEVARAVARGLTNAQIAGDLYLGETTVKTHIANILAKLNLRDRVQIVVFAYESGLIRPGDALAAS